MTLRETYEQSVEAYNNAVEARMADRKEKSRLCKEAGDAMDKAEIALMDSDEPREYTLNDGHGGEDTCFCSPSEIEEEWRDWMSNGEWGDDSETTWVSGWATDEFDRTHHYTYTIEPTEPECTEGDHKWRTPYSVVGGLKENPGVYGHGGGARGTEVCCHCGLYRIWDSWAQDPATGKQGLSSTEYREADDASLDYVWRCLANDAEDVPAPDGYTIARARGRNAMIVTRESDDEEVVIDETQDIRQVVDEGSWDCIVRHMPAEVDA